MRSSIRAACAVAGILVTAVIGACEGDEILGPPDGAACTVGSIASGDSVSGEVTGASCEMFDVLGDELVRAESWTLNAKANTAYVVRLRHVENANASDNWDGELHAYTRNAQGDAIYATRWWGSFDDPNANGGDNLEMFLVTDTDRTFSVRVQVSSLADTGAYTLSIASCPLHPLQVGTPLTGVDASTSQCLSNAFYGARLDRLTFFSFPTDTFHTYTVSGDRTAGTSPLYAVVSGPDLDHECATEDCTWDGSGPEVTSFDIIPGIDRPGLHFLTVDTRADSTATLDVEVTSALIAAPMPITSTRRPTGARTH